jgi:DNA-binding beta-propeller fold protein YncE
VSDTNNDRLQKFTSTGAYVLEIASWGGGTGPGKGKNKGDRFNKPQGVAVDSSGNVWAADRNNDRALKFSSEGGFLLELKAGLNKPHGVALDARDNLYVADRNNDRVLKFSPEGELLLTIDTGAGGELNKPQGVLAVDRNGLLYVADRNNDRVLVYDSSGAFVRELGEGPGGGPGQFNKPDGIALNALAYAFVADTNNSRVQKFDPYGNLVLVFDRASNDLEPLNHPGGLALDAEGNLFVVDSNNARVKKYGADGELVVIASQDDGGGGGGEDGERAGRLVVKGSGGKVHHPRGITLDIPAGALAADTEITITAGRKAEGYGYKASGAGRGKKLAGVTEGVEFGPDGTVFAEPVTISIPYDPARVPAGVDESELAVCRFDPASGVWEELPSSVDSRLRIVSARTEHFSLYAVMAPAVEGAAFALGEVYVFPNPALRGASPTFHIECGFADSVNIKIYTTSGRFAHETTLTGQPRVVDDGQGAQYVYEYAWREHIPSGVYYYLIEAARAGQKLKKTGKFAVVR